MVIFRLKAKCHYIVLLCLNCLQDCGMTGLNEI